MLERHSQRHIARAGGGDLGRARFGLWRRWEQLEEPVHQIHDLSSATHTYTLVCDLQLPFVGLMEIDHDTDLGRLKTNGPAARATARLGTARRRSCYIIVCGTNARV